MKPNRSLSAMPVLAPLKELTYSLYNECSKIISFIIDYCFDLVMADFNSHYCSGPVKALTLKFANSPRTSCITAYEAWLDVTSINALSPYQIEVILPMRRKPTNEENNTCYILSASIGMRVSSISTFISRVTTLCYFIFTLYTLFNTLGNTM